MTTADSPLKTTIARDAVVSSALVDVTADEPLATTITCDAVISSASDAPLKITIACDAVVSLALVEVVPGIQSTLPCIHCHQLPCEFDDFDIVLWERAASYIDQCAPPPTNNMIRYDLYSYYSRRLLGIRNVRKRIVTCVENGIKEKFPNLYGEAYVRFQNHGE